MCSSTAEQPSPRPPRDSTATPAPPARPTPRTTDRAGTRIRPDSLGVPAPPAPGTVRVATFNTALSGSVEGGLAAELSDPAGSEQARLVAEVLQRVRPDIVLLAEFDHDADGSAATTFGRDYLAVPQRGAEPLRYDHRFLGPVNTGVPSGFDLNRDGRFDGPDDAWGYGYFPGQYGMLLLSRYPIDDERVRTFQRFRWRDLPGALLPSDPDGGAYYPPEVLDRFPLSSKSHWDVPVQLGARTLHVLVCHPTPPAFDGPERRNVRRNHDEVRFWVDYLSPDGAEHLRDDAGTPGGLPPGAEFVVLGDLNADPSAGDREPGAIRRLLAAPRLIDTRPGSLGALETALRRGWSATAWTATADFGVDGPGCLRVDYALPSAGTNPGASGVCWPPSWSALARLIRASDHRLVWVDLRW
ncbi:endonuclease/exonuclease/phosphatase family protein [Actinoalloteichus spitiensis]|uniref:endonuclease/exonuclease/phosphatase family protein n=1 Tax=Actinoalloteichus spitiensis TaxID=252394 RepID=UPI0003638673|nr:endonuclease/exonuclease/phosphatase family protein [Actinoalloteichus spitiensis]